MLGDFEIRARLVRDPATFDGEVGRPRAAGSIIPDDAFLDLDPLNSLEQQERVYSEIDELLALNAPSLEDSRQRADYARIDMESLMVPELIAPQLNQSQRRHRRLWSVRAKVSGSISVRAGRGSSKASITTPVKPWH